jgi:hypothetical protein
VGVAFLDNVTKDIVTAMAIQDDQGGKARIDDGTIDVIDDGIKVLDEMLTVPRHALCSWEHEIVTGGSWRRGYVLASSRDIADAIAVSVISGR